MTKLGSTTHQFRRVEQWLSSYVYVVSFHAERSAYHDFDACSKFVE